MRSTRGGICATSDDHADPDADARGLAQEHAEVLARGAEQHDQPRGAHSAHREQQRPVEMQRLEQPPRER